MSESLAIAVVCHDYPKGTSHAGAFVQARVDLYRKRGHEVHVFSRSSEDLPSGRGCDVVAAHYPLPEYVIPAAMPFVRRGIRVVPFLHGAEAIRVPNKPFLWGMKAKFALKRFLRMCDTPIVASRWMRDRVRENLGVDSIVIPNPVDPDLFPILPRGHPTGRGLCLRGRAWKYGVDLLEGISSVDVLEPRFRRRELPGLLEKYDFFVAPSRLEGQGLMACEALATGMPVISTIVGGIPEFVTDPHSILVADPSRILLERAVRRMHDRVAHLTVSDRIAIRSAILVRCGPEATVERDLEVFRGSGS